MVASVKTKMPKFPKVEDIKGNNIWEKVLNNFLEKHPTRINGAFATRCALRSLPLPFINFTDHNKEFKNLLQNVVTIKIMQATALSRTVIFANISSGAIDRAARSIHMIANSIDSLGRSRWYSTASSSAYSSACAAILNFSIPDKNGYRVEGYMSQYYDLNSAELAAYAARSSADSAASAVKNVHSVALRLDFEKSAEADLARIAAGIEDLTLAQLHLWNEMPAFAQQAWENMKTALRGDENAQHWEFWLEWYQGVLDGKKFDPEREAHGFLIDEEEWESVATAVPAIRKKLEEYDAAQAEADAQEQAIIPPEPLEIEGAEIIIEDGKLTLSSGGQSHANEDEREDQTFLHNRLKLRLPLLKEQTRGIANEYSEFKTAFSELETEMAASFETLDIRAIWAYGLALETQIHYIKIKEIPDKENDPKNYLPLLSEIETLTQAFIRAFPKGRQLLGIHSKIPDKESIASVKSSMGELTHYFADKKDVFSAKLRKIFDRLHDATCSPAWQTTEAGYATYILLRNSLIKMGKYLNKVDKIPGAIGGGAVTYLLGIDGTLFGELINLFRFHAAPILAFSRISPELNVWISYIIEHLHIQKQSQPSS